MGSPFDETLRRVLDGLRTLETVRNREFLREVLLEVAELERLHRELEKRCASLERRAAELEEKTARLSGRLIEDRGALWRPGNEEPGPYCLGCWRDDRKLVLLRTAADRRRTTCPRCGRTT